MKANGMMVPKRKKYSCTPTKQDKSLVPSPNLVKDMDINGPDRALCSDMTYIYTEEGFLFLSLMMDMFVHDIVGWAVSESLKAEGPLETLAMASRTLKPGAKRTRIAAVSTLRAPIARRSRSSAGSPA